MRKIVLTILFLFLAGLLPLQITYAANSSHIMQVQIEDRSQNFIQGLNASKTITVKHDVNSFFVSTMDPSSSGTIDLSYSGQATLKDMNGNMIPLNMENASGLQPYWKFTIDNVAYPLKPNQIYTLTLNGWKDKNGEVIPAYIYTFITDNSPINKTYQFNYRMQNIYGVDDFHLYQAHYPSHTEIYHLSVSSGALTYSLSGMSENTDHVTVTFESGDSVPDVLYQKTLAYNDLGNWIIQIPKNGEYNLIVEPDFVHPNYPYSFIVSGPDLNMSDEAPNIQFQKFTYYEVYNSSLDLKVVSPVYGSALDINVDGKLVKTVKPDTLGYLSGDDNTVDTSNLIDGVHQLSYVVHGNQSGNEEVYSRPFLVDRNGSFSDVPIDYWGHHVIDAMYDLGIINGRSQTEFDPEDTITRAEFAALLSRTLHLSLSYNGSESFSDVPLNAWYRPFVDALKQAGFVAGVSNNNQLYFEPDRPISRAEAATMISRTRRNLQGNEYADQIKDFYLVPDYAKTAIASLYLNGWLSGYPDGTIQAKRPLTRAEAATLLSHYLDM